MDSAMPVVGVSFILLAAGFALGFARLIARGQIALKPDWPVFPPQPRAHPSEFRGEGADIPLLSTSPLLTILP
jgi:hypothetical protein